MAGPRTRSNAGRAPINNIGTLIPTPAVSCTPTCTPAWTFVLAEASALAQAFTTTPAPTSAFVLGLSGIYTDEDLQRVIKLTLELFVEGQKHG